MKFLVIWEIETLTSQTVKAVMSITLRPRLITLAKVRLSNLVALGSFSGSEL